jgi:ABC-type transport system involved in multi-copper enzyme maturation permease subunit
MYWDGVRTVLGIGRGGKAKILPMLMFIAAMLPAAVFVIILSFASETADFLPGPGDYYEIISLMLFIFGAIMAPELLSPDRKDRVLDLYLVRPITSSDYVFARVLAFFTVVLALAYSGQIVLQVGLILTATDPVEFIQENWLDIPRFLAAGALVAAFITVIPMAVAAFTTRRAYASAFIIGLFMITWVMANILTAQSNCTGNARTVDGRISFEEVECEPVTGDAAKWVSLMSVRMVPLLASDLVFDRVEADAEPSVIAARDLPDAVPILVYAAYIVFPIWLLWWQYRRIRI